MLRKVLLKLLTIFCVIFLVIFLVPSFTSYKKTNKKVNDDLKNEIKIESKDVHDGNFTTNMSTLKDASIKFFDKSESLPTKTGDKETVLLKTLYKEDLTNKLKTSDNIDCDSSKSYAKITKLSDDYELKVYLKCNNNADYTLSRIGEYSYCSSSLCEKDLNKELVNNDINKNNEDGKKTTNESDVKENRKEEVKKEDNKESINNSQTTNNSNTSNTNTNSNKKLVWGPWSDYKRSLCSVSEVKCNEDDYNCRREIETKRVTEKVGNSSNNMHVYPLELQYVRTSSEYLCTNYNYFYINGILYRSTGNYEEVLGLGTYSTSNWTYQGEVKLNSVPNFGGFDYYKFKDIGSDFKTYIFYKYHYNKDINKASVRDNCIGTFKSVNYYNVVKKGYNVNFERPVYADACYMRERVR